MVKIPVSWLVVLGTLSPLSCKSGRDSGEILATATIPPSAAAIYRTSPGFLCDGLPRAMVETMAGYCVGLGAVENLTAAKGALVLANGAKPLKFPRNIRQVDANGPIQRFLVTDMGGWVNNGGSLWLLTYDQQHGQTDLKRLLDKLDQPHGLEVDGNRVFIGFLDRIVEVAFDPSSGAVSSTPQILIRNMPGRTDDALANKLADVSNDGTRTRNNHPLKHFIMSPDKKAFIVNVGAPDDACQSYTKKARRGECHEYVTSNYATLYSIKIPAPGGGPLDLLIDGTAVAHGLRNSMALAFRDSTLYQGENSVDISDQFVPYEEINAIVNPLASSSGMPFFGWPYCYDNSANDRSEFVGGTKCQQSNYRKPMALMPAHVSPLGMAYYSSSGPYSELHDSLIIGWHGHQPQGSKIVFYPFSGDSLKTQGSDVAFWYPDGSEDYSKRKIVQKKIPVDGASGPQAQHQELISRWEAVDCIRPKGAPVGLTIATDGAIWVVEDKNKTILRIAKANDPSVTGTDMPFTSENPCGKTANGAEIVKISADRAEVMARLTAQNDTQAAHFESVAKAFLAGGCNGCHGAAHGDFFSPSGEIDRGKFIRFLIRKDGWIEPGLPEESFLYQLLSGTEPDGRVMPPGGQFACTDPGADGPAKDLREWIDSLYPHDSRTTGETYQDLRVRFSGTGLAVRARPGDDGANVEKCGALTGANPAVFKARTVPAENGSRFQDWLEIYVSSARAKKYGIDISQTCGGQKGVYYIARVNGVNDVDPSTIKYCR